MITCKNCGAQIADNAIFCSSCGAKVVPETVAAPVTENIAPVTENTAPVQPEEAPAAENTAPVQPNVYEAPYQNGQPVNNGMPYQNGQPVNNGMPYQNAQPVNGGMPYQNGQPVNNGMPYQNGQPVNNGMPYQNGQPVNNGMPYQGGYNPYGYQNAVPVKNKKTGLIIGILIAAIVIIAVVLVLILGGGGNRNYKAVTKQFMNGIKKHDLSMMAETVAPKSYQEKWLENQLYWYDDEDEFWNAFDENMEWYCGAHVKYSYEIEEADRMDEDELEDVEDDLWSDYDYRANVTDGYELEIVLHVKGDDDTYDESIDLTVIEIKGKWYTYWW